MVLKGQSAIEYLSIVGIGLLIATPFIVLVQEDITSLQTDSADARFSASLDEMESAIRRADALGESAQTGFTLEVPDNIQSARVVGDKNIVFTQNRSRELSNYTILLDSNVSATSLPTERGRYRFTARYSGGEVILEYGEFIADFKPLEPIIAGNEVTLQDESQSSRKVIDTREWYVNSSLEQTGSEKFSYTFSDSKVYNVSLRIVATDGTNDQVSKLYKAEESEILAFSVESQSEWNLGTFSRASADRNDNSGNLGLGYLNGSNPSSTNLEEGLIGYWSMDRNIGGSGGEVIDYSGNQNNGTALGGVNTGLQGILGSSSFEFDYSDQEYVDHPDLTDQFDDEATISLWLKRSDVNTPSNSGATGIFNYGYNQNNDRSHYPWTDGNLYFSTFADDRKVDGLDNTGFNKTKWHHFLVTTSPGTDNYRVYQNGSLIAERDGPESLTLPNNMRFGYSDASYYFNGKMDEVRLYNRTLTENEVEQLYLDGKPFKGNYTSEAIEKSEQQNWNALEIDASIPSSTDLTATFETLKDSLIFDRKQKYSGVIDWNQGRFNKSTADEIVTEYNYPSELEASNQSTFNKGSFKATSADRKDNSGDLGLGYRNGSTGDDLVGYWRMDRNPSGSGGDVKDYSGEGNNGTTQGSLDTGNQGIFSSQSFEFDGSDDYVKTNYNGLGGSGESFTVSMWLKSSYSFSGNHFPVNNYVDSGHGGFFAIGSDDNSQGMFFWLRDSSRTEVAKTGYYQPAWDGKWHHYVGVRDIENDEVRFYIDGNLKENITSTNTNAVRDSDSFLGFMRHNGGSSQTNPGKLDEVMAFRRALNSSEVENLYLSGSGGVFEGNYTAKKIDNSQKTSWDSLEVNASIPSETSVNATFRALDADDSLVDSQQIDLSEGLNNYSLSVSNSEDAEVFINGTSSNVTKSWEVHSLEVFSSEVVDKIDGLRIGYRNDSAGDDLVGYWRMDTDVSGDGGTVKDYSGEGNDGIAQNGVSTGSDGAFGTKSFKFDGVDDVVKSNLTYNDNNNFTLAAWVKADNWSSYIPIIIGNPYGNNVNAGMTGRLGKLTFWDFSSNGKPAVQSNEDLKTNEWQHVAISYENGEVSLYIDGVNVKTENYNIAESGWSGTIIGRAGGTNEANQMDGQIDEARVYNTSLTDEQIKTLYFNGLPFKGSYTAERIDNDKLTNWNRLEINASIPSETDLTAKFKALNSKGLVVDKEVIAITDSTLDYPLNVRNSQDAVLEFNGTSSNASKSWSIYDYKVYSGEREVDESESFDVQDGFNELLLGVSDSKDARIRLNGTSSDITQSWSVSNMSVFTE